MNDLMAKIITPNMEALNAHFKNAGFTLWVVGGAVRDTLMGESPKDIDFATDATPEEQITIYENSDLRWFPTGLQHGTVTVVVDGEAFEVTTLRTETNHDGRYADMAFTRSINNDLGRRDLTINAMALDFDGNLIDPYNGESDLRAKRVRFVGNADARIREDYLRILRWFRFHARIASGSRMDYETSLAVRRNAEGLRNISRERVWSEISKLLTYENPGAVFKEMLYLGVHAHIELPVGDADEMQFARKYTSNPSTLIAMYLREHGHTLNQLSKAWKWSTKETDHAIQVLKLRNQVLTEQEMKYQIAVEGQRLDYTIEALRAGGRTSCANRMAAWEVPTFPVTGDDLIAAGVKPGPEMGEHLKTLRRKWGVLNYTPTKEQLLADAPSFGWPCDYD